MFPHPSGATTPVAPLASKPQDNDNVDGVMPPSWSDTESASAKSRSRTGTP